MENQLNSSELSSATIHLQLIHLFRTGYVECTKNWRVKTYLELY